MKIKRYITVVLIVVCIVNSLFQYFVSAASVAGSYHGMKDDEYILAADADGSGSDLWPADAESNSLQLPVIMLTENLLTYETGTWPPFYPKPDGEPEPHPFDGMAAFNACYADLNCDGVYEAYATIHSGSGIVTSYLLGYDPVTRHFYKLDQRMEMDFSFLVFHDELFVAAWPFWKGEPPRYYRPQPKPEWSSFDLIPIDETLAADISSSLDVKQRIEKEEEAGKTKFGYVVREEIVNREVALREEDFNQLKKGQQIKSPWYRYFMSSAQPREVIETVGIFDGEIIYASVQNPYSLALVPLKRSLYYKLDENTYAVLFFSSTSGQTFLGLDHIEIWDEKGNRLKEVELEP